MLDPQVENDLNSEQSISESDLTTLLELGQMSYRLTEREIVHKALVYAVNVTKSKYGYLHFINKDQKTLQLTAWSERTSEQCKTEFTSHNSLDQAGVWADCFRIGKPVVHNDYQNLPDQKGYPDGHVHLLRHTSVPLYDKDKLRLILGVGNKENDYNSKDVLQLSLVGDQLVRTLQNRQIENAYSKTKHQYDHLVKYIPIGIFRVRTSQDESITFEYVNQQFCEMINITARAAYQDPNSVLNSIHPDDLNGLVALIRNFKQTSNPFLWEGRFIVGEKIKWLKVEARPEAVQKGKIVWHGVLIDNSERKQAEDAYLETNNLLENRLAEIEQLQEQLREQAIRDYLTGLYNRRYLDETIEREIARAKRGSFQLCIVLMDIDHFKSINDTYGHQAGDMVLTELGALLKKYSRASDITCRYGGDEFVVVMPNASPEDALKRADEWRWVFERSRFTTNGQRFATTLSMGIASYPLHASSPKGVFQAADQALYQSKMHNNKVSISRRVATEKLRSIGRDDT